MLKLIAGNTKYDGKQNERKRLGIEFTNFIKNQRRSGKENAPHQTDIHHENKIFSPPVSTSTFQANHSLQTCQSRVFITFAEAI